MKCSLELVGLLYEKSEKNGGKKEGRNVGKV